MGQIVTVNQCKNAYLQGQGTASCAEREIIHQ